MPATPSDLLPAGIRDTKAVIAAQEIVKVQQIVVWALGPDRPARRGLQARPGDLGLSTGHNAVMSKVSVVSVLLVSVVLASLSGCSKDDDGPLLMAGYGNVLDGAKGSPYFTITMCAEGDEPADIEITSVEAVGFQGAPREPEFEVAWASTDGQLWPISSHGPVPDAFVPAMGEKGTISPCSDEDQHSALAVVFPAAGHQPVRLEDVELTYEVDGDTYTTKAEAFLAQCPLGSVAGTDAPISAEQTLCRPIRKVRTS